MTGAMTGGEISRRAFLKGGGALIVGFGLARTGLAAPANAAPPGSPLPVPVDQVDSYLTIHADNTVSLFSSIVERGNGTRTSLLMIAAEELDVGMDQISFARLDTSTTPFSGIAGGSQGTSIGGSFTRAAAATAKQALLGLASTNLGVPAASLSVHRGIVSGGGKRVTYGELVDGKLFDLAIPQQVQRNDLGVFQYLLRPGLEPGEAPAKPIDQYKLVGRPQPRVDVPGIDWATYPSLRFKDHPDVTPIVIQQLDAVPGGAGEEPITALFPAIANAFFDATGARIRQVPMKPAVVRDALARAGRKKPGP